MSPDDYYDGPVPSPWPEDGFAAVLDEAEQFIARFVAFPTEAARVAVTLWAAHAHAVESFDSSPRLALLSPEPGSGKTRTLEVLDLLVPRPMHVLNASVAVTFRAVDNHQPTLLLDEVDAIFGRRTKDENEDLRGLLNAGHRRGAQVPRCVGPNHELKLFNVYAATALAGLGDLPDTLMSRSVVVRMRRRARGAFRTLPSAHARAGVTRWGSGWPGGGGAGRPRRRLARDASRCRGPAGGRLGAVARDSRRRGRRLARAGTGRVHRAGQGSGIR